MLRLPVSENFEVFIPCSCVQTCDPLGRSKFSQGASYEQTWRCTRKCYIPNIKAPCLPVSERKNFEVGLLCSFEYYYVPSCDPQGGANFDPSGII